MDHPSFDSTAPNSDGASEDRLRALIDERLDVEALAQMVEHLDYEEKLSTKLTHAFNENRREAARQSHLIAAIQMELRDLIMDVALVKRALVSLGHLGVMERKKIEHQLVRELFEPTQPRPGAGIGIVSSEPRLAEKVDCHSRLHLCKAACCRIFQVHLSASEVAQDAFEWDSRQPYALKRNQTGCVHLKAGSCQCAVYESRPAVCQSYSCKYDRRIWADFEKMILNPELSKRLETLDVNTTATDLSPESVRSSGRPSMANSNGNAVIIASTPLEDAGIILSDGSVVVEMPPILPGREEGQTSTVQPPNFDDLRNLMVPLPNKRFVPKRDHEQCHDSADSAENAE